MVDKNTWVVIPAHNESKRIVSVIKGVKKHIKNIIVVDDGSSDDTYDVSKKEKCLSLLTLEERNEFKEIIDEWIEE